ncbi:hypothetical protein M1N22_02015 [Dehalococcoidia bacterium]|nr:hypothetical protein [Dehalococcoidia bacterium]
MNLSKEKKRLRRERDYYETIKTKLEELIGTKFSNFHLEITADKKFTNKLKAEISPHGQRDIIFHFLKEAAPDITGFIKGEYFSDFIVVEIKDEEIRIDHIYQTRKYAELFNAKYVLLISTKEIPEEIKRLSKVVDSLLSGCYGYEKMTLVYFDAERGDFVEWFEKNPFEQGQNEGN